MARADRAGRGPILRRAALALLAAAVALGSRPLRCAEEPITLNFVNADIEAVATAIGRLTGRNFVIDPRVKGSINIVSSRPVSVSAAYDAFLSALRLQGFAAVEAGAVVKILPEAEARLHLGPAGVRAVPAGERLVTQVFSLRYAAAALLVPVLRPIISPHNPIVAYSGSNSLVVTDYAENLRRIASIIEALDRPGTGEPVVIPLRYAAAGELSQTLARLLGDGADPGLRVAIAADLRTNSLVVRSDNSARIARVQELVQRLDVPTSAAANVHVVYLKNADAVRVARTLRAILGGEGAAPSGPLRPLAPPLPAAAAPTSEAPTVAAAALADTASGPLPVGIAVHADSAANAVIIAAPDAIFAQLRSVIEKLDIRRAQVYVEALIVEVSAEKAAEFGIQWQSLDDLSATESRIIGGTNFGARASGANIIDAAVNLGSVGRGLNIGIVRGQIMVPGVGTVTNLSVLARALETDTRANILSTPNLLTLDNEEARIVIGQNVPFITGQYALTGAATTPTPFQTIERRDVGLTLRIRPQITEGGSVRLQIYQEVSSVQDRTNVAGIITNKRSIESTVLVDDGQIVALGGLVQDSADTGTEKIPLLGDLPIVGGLFRYETRRQTKTNLMVFLRPVVMRDSTSYGGVTGERYRQLLGEQEKARPAPHPVLPDMEGPRLPPLPQNPGADRPASR